MLKLPNIGVSVEIKQELGFVVTACFNRQTIAW